MVYHSEYFVASSMTGEVTPPRSVRVTRLHQRPHLRTDQHGVYVCECFAVSRLAHGLTNKLEARLQFAQHARADLARRHPDAALKCYRLR